MIILIILIFHIIFSYGQNISLILLCERWIPCQASTSVLCLHYRTVTVHCSTKDAHTSEITFLALNPWYYRLNWVSVDLTVVFYRTNRVFSNNCLRRLIICIYNIPHHVHTRAEHSSVNETNVFENQRIMYA